MRAIQPYRKAFALLITLAAWFALALQFKLMLFDTASLHPATAAVNFFSYFTILSNLIVAVYTLLTVINNRKYENRASATSIAVYIFIVGLVYNTVLRSTWEPSGWQLVADNLLHLVVPVLFVLYWFIFTPSRVVAYRNLPRWLIFPLIYLVYSLIRGSMVHWYPYPFLDVDKLGYALVIRNAGLVTLAFVLIGLLFIRVNRRRP